MRFEKIYNQLLSERTKQKSEQIILVIAIASFLIHLILIFLVDWGIVQVYTGKNLLGSPIAAIYTPFSFILVYEVYLLIHYLPKSITTYISKQYEIITLIIIRRLFKDFSNLSLTEEWFNIKYDLQFTYDLVASILLFFLIYLFYKQSKKRFATAASNSINGKGIETFIRIKRIIATILVPVLMLTAIYSFCKWTWSVLNPVNNNQFQFTNINNIFFEQFFTILIIADVILLLFSFFHTDEFHKVIRNSGFIISTILIRLSFSVSGLPNLLLILSATLFGLLILFIHNKFEQEIHLQESKT